MVVRPEDKQKTTILVVVLVVVLAVIGFTLFKAMAGPGGDSNTAADPVEGDGAPVENAASVRPERSRKTELMREVNLAGANPFHAIRGIGAPPTRGGPPVIPGGGIGGPVEIYIPLPASTLKGVIMGGDAIGPNLAVMEISGEIQHMLEGENLYPGHRIQKIQEAGMTLSVDGVPVFIGLGETYQPVGPEVDGVQPLSVF